MRMLFSCNEALGHVHPLLPLAHAAREAGHEVAFMSGPALPQILGEDSFDFLACGPEFGVLVGEALGRHPDANLATPEEQQEFGFRYLFSETRVALTIADATQCAEQFAPDLVVNEIADFLGPLVAADRGIPNATAGVSLVLRPEADETFPDDLEHLGKERPLVYVTFGSIFGDPTAPALIGRAIADLDVDLLMTVGFEIDPSSLGLDGPTVAVRSFVPQGAVLPRCRLVVTHGGAGSVIGALRYGIPLLIVPVGADQSENCEQVMAVGAGRQVPLQELSRDRVRETVRSMLKDDDAVAIAEGLRREMLDMPTPDQVVPVLEMLASG